MQCILGPFGPQIYYRIFGLSVSFPPKVKFLDETLTYLMHIIRNRQRWFEFILLQMPER